MSPTQTAAVPFLDLKEQYASLREELIAAAVGVMDSGQSICGPEVRAFEAEFASALGARHCAGVSNGTDAIELSLKALGVGPGDEVVVPAFTFIATASAVRSVGAEPAFADIDPLTFTLDPAGLERAITKKTRAVIPVHLYGWPADMDSILSIAKSASIAVVEDCAQSHGALYRGRPAGTLGDAGTFSFYPTKNMGALGDAGAVLTGSEALHQGVLCLRDAGRAAGERYLHSQSGRNARLDELQAAFLRVKLKRLGAFNDSRRRWAGIYREAFAGLPLGLPPKDRDGSRHVYHIFAVRTPRRDELARALGGQGVGNAVYYPVPLHLQPAFRDLGRGEGDFPEAERACREVLCLPMFPELGPERAQRAAEAVKGFFRRSP